MYKATATTEIYTYGHTRSLHDALPISDTGSYAGDGGGGRGDEGHYDYARVVRVIPVGGAPGGYPAYAGGYGDPSGNTRYESGGYYGGDRKSTRLHSSH